MAGRVVLDVCERIVEVVSPFHFVVFSTCHPLIDVRHYRTGTHFAATKPEALRPNSSILPKYVLRQHFGRSDYRLNGEQVSWSGNNASAIARGTELSDSL